MPLTFLTFGAGWLAICGIPPFAGFFSKDEILWQAYSAEHGNIVLWALGALTAVMTAFYMTRLFVLTFFGKERFESHGKGAHESPWIMVGPLAVLAVLSVLGGFMGVPHASWLEHWLEPVIPAHEAVGHAVQASMEWTLMGVSVVGATLGILGAIGVFSNLGERRASEKPSADS